MKEGKTLLHGRTTKVVEMKGTVILVKVLEMYDVLATF